jgi:hypothetical protein
LIQDTNREIRAVIEREKGKHCKVLMPYLFSKLKTDEKYRKAERERELEREILCFLAGTCLFCLLRVKVKSS